MTDYSELSDKELLTLYENKVSQHAAKNNLQMSIKILMNSLYGSVANRGFRFFNQSVAESITLLGQYVLRTLEKEIDQVLNAKFKTENIKYLIYIDTDSITFELKEVVEKFKLHKDTIKKIEKLVQEIVQTEVNKIVSRVADQLNVYENKLQFKLESVTDKAIYCSKKRYIQRVHSSEGVTYQKPKYKVMGLEMVRSSTPQFVRKKLRESLEIIFNQGEAATQEFIAKTKQEFIKLDAHEIASISTANNLDNFSDSSNIYRKRTPIHIRGSLLYNFYLKQHGIDGKYPMITDKAKVKYIYLKLPNRIKENIISIPADGILPPEFEIQDRIDYDMQYEKTMIGGMLSILDAINWSPEEISSLDDFFN